MPCSGWAYVGLNVWLIKKHLDQNKTILKLKLIGPLAKTLVKNMGDRFFEDMKVDSIFVAEIFYL